MVKLFDNLVVFFNEITANNQLEIDENTSFPNKLEVSSRILEKYQNKIRERRVLFSIMRI